MSLEQLAQAAKAAFASGLLQPERRTFGRYDREDRFCGCAVTAAYMGSGGTGDGSDYPWNVTSSDMNKRLNAVFGVTQEEIRGLIQGFDGEDQALPFATENVERYTAGWEAGRSLAKEVFQE